MSEIRKIVEDKKAMEPQRREASRLLYAPAQERKQKEYKWFRRCSTCQKGMYDYKTQFLAHEMACKDKITAANEMPCAINCPKCFKRLDHLNTCNRIRHIESCKISFINIKKISNKGKVYKVSKKMKKKNSCATMREAKNTKNKKF